MNNLSFASLKSTQCEIKQPILWGLSASPYVRKVMVALNEMNIAYEQIETLPTILLKATGQTVPAEFEQISPLGKIPVLQIGDFSISDSAVICAYLEKKFLGDPLLYPNNAEDHVKALWFEHYSDNVLTEICYRKIFFECVVKPKILNLQPDKTIVENAKQNELPPLLNFLDKSLKDKTYIVGEQLSIGDIAITTQLLALIMADFEIKTSRWKYLNSYLEKILSRPSFKKFEV